MNLCIDRGNSSTKIGIFDQDNLVFVSEYITFDALVIDTLKKNYHVDSCILSTVRLEESDLIAILQQSFKHVTILSGSTPIPVTNAYKTPETLGKDRLAAVIGANSLYPGRNLLVIDAGTAITYDFINADGIYEGGNITPGIDLRLKSLHTFTQKLPLVTLDESEKRLGDDTRSAIASGVLWGVIYEIDGNISYLMLKYPDLLVLLTGGSIFYFFEKLKNPIFAEKNLVLIGLNRILQYNVYK